MGMLLGARVVGLWSHVAADDDDGIFFGSTYNIWD